VRTLKFSLRSITTNSGYTRPWATVLRKSLKDKPSAKVRQQMRKERRSPLSLAWLNLLQGCWSRGLKRRPLLQTSSPLEKASTQLHEGPSCAKHELSQQRGSKDEKLQVCQSSLSQPRGSPQFAVSFLCPSQLDSVRSLQPFQRFVNTVHAGLIIV